MSALPTALGIGNNLFTSTITYRFNENWGFRAIFPHRFEARNGDLEEQAYTVYRDLRSWTAALTLRVLENPTGPQDVTVAFASSSKPIPITASVPTRAGPTRCSAADAPAIKPLMLFWFDLV